MFSSSFETLNVQASKNEVIYLLNFFLEKHQLLIHVQNQIMFLTKSIPS